MKGLSGQLIVAATIDLSTLPEMHGAVKPTR
jgi:hypothetical protein